MGMEMREQVVEIRTWIGRVGVGTASGSERERRG